MIVIKGGLVMLKRKTEGILKKWKDTEGHKPLIIKGCRQCGKTFSVRQFARENYAHEIYLNFYENKSYALPWEYRNVWHGRCQVMSVCFGTDAEEARTLPSLSPEHLLSFFPLANAHSGFRCGTNINRELGLVFLNTLTTTYQTDEGNTTAIQLLSTKSIDIIYLL